MKKTLWWFLFGFALVFILFGCGTTEPEPRKLTIPYTIVLTGTWCASIDFTVTQVRLYDNVANVARGRVMQNDSVTVRLPFDSLTLMYTGFVTAQLTQDPWTSGPPFPYTVGTINSGPYGWPSEHPRDHFACNDTTSAP